jgi:hypothetical protein
MRRTRQLFKTTKTRFKTFSKQRFHMISHELALNLIMETNEPRTESEIRNRVIRYVKIVCVRSQGSMQGTKYTKYARYGAPNKNEATSEKKTGDVFSKQERKKTHLENGTIPMTEIGNRFDKNGYLVVDKENYFSPNIYHIDSLNDQNVKY